jgi:uncharacterized membrane-anchored protein YhcB (DUF1043 family)
MFFYLIAQLMILMLTHQLVLSVGLKTAQTLVCSILRELQKHFFLTSYLLDNLLQLVLTPQNMTSCWSKG